MNNYNVPIDWSLLADEKFQEYVEVLKYMGVEEVLDVKSFTEGMGYEPDIGSIFIYGLGGSYDFRDSEYGKVVICNGTLGQVGGYYFKGLGETYSIRAFKKQV